MARESYLVSNILVALRDAGAYARKNHGNPYQYRGRPDVDGCYRGYYIGLEVKVPPNTPSDLQRHEIREILLAGGIAGVVYCVEDAVRLLKNFPQMCRACFQPATAELVVCSRCELEYGCPSSTPR